MRDHLPECDTQHNGLLPCICEPLRACEQRMLDDDVLAAAYHGQAGYAAGLDAARKAVAALEPLLDRSKHEGGYDCCGCATVGYLWTDALAAIDALKEDK